MSSYQHKMHSNLCILMLLTERCQKSRTINPGSWTQFPFLFPLQLHFHLQTHHVFPIRMNLFKIKMTWRDGTPIINHYIQETKAYAHLPARTSGRLRKTSRRYPDPTSFSSYTAPLIRLPAGPLSSLRCSATAQYRLIRSWAETKL
jgi:hypothetical protein